VAWLSPAHLLRGAVLCALLLCLLAIRPVAAADLPRGGRAPDELALGILDSPGSLHPNSTDSGYAFIRAFAHRHMAAPDESWHVVCYLCETLPTLKDGDAKLVALPDGGQGLDVTFTLMPGLSWADGTKVTTDDVIFSWQLGRTPGIGYANTQIFDDITSITRLDQRRFTLHLKRASYQYNTPYFFEILPQHVEAPIVGGLADKSSYLAHSAYETDPTNPGLWLGPYRLTQFTHGQRAVFERNPFWPGRIPYFRQVTLRTYPDTASLTKALREGDIDAFTGIYLPAEQLHRLSAELGDDFDVTSQPTTRFVYVALNLARPIFQDKRVRQALFWALDREQITHVVLDDPRPVANSFLNPRDPGYDPRLQVYSYRPDKARQLLGEAGYVPNGEGVWARADGTRLSLQLLYGTAPQVIPIFAQEIAAQWRVFGIDATEIADPGYLLGRVKHRDFDAEIATFNSVPEFPPEMMLTSQGIPSAPNNFAGFNYSGYANPRMDALIARLIGELDETRRTGIWSDIQSTYLEDLPTLPIFHLPTMSALPHWLTGFIPTGQYTPPSAAAENWGRRG
jgi:peptide/nickel transport system substrate-binding protein